MKHKPITEKSLLENIEADVRRILNLRQDQQSLELLREGLRMGVTALDRFRADKLEKERERAAKRERKRLGVNSWMNAVRNTPTDN